MRQVFSYYFGFPYHSFHRLFHAHHHPSSGAGTTGQIVAEVADVPSSLNLTHLKKLIIFPRAALQLLQRGTNITLVRSRRWVPYQTVRTRLFLCFVLRIHKKLCTQDTQLSYMCNAKSSFNSSLLVPAKIYCQSLGWDLEWLHNVTVCSTGLSH
jgi:hypothetical protein